MYELPIMYVLKKPFAKKKSLFAWVFIIFYTVQSMNLWC